MVEVAVSDPRAKGDADSKSDSNTGTYQADPARPDDHRYQLDHAVVGLPGTADRAHHSSAICAKGVPGSMPPGPVVLERVDMQRAVSGASTGSTLARPTMTGVRAAQHNMSDAPGPGDSLFQAAGHIDHDRRCV